uniref:Uncharacterized protein n=1 Tax=Siphoviridae sp. ct0uL16 TaxID=2825299 RepID=A0A8S5Q6E7_9CAUD|nr:MAG TPA: hypothetical protein [Siphoviridae sp. ct0uL16]
MIDEQIVKALEYCSNAGDCKKCAFNVRNANCINILMRHTIDLINRQKAEIEKLKAFKSSFDELYGKGLDIANWHLNGALEPFDSFYESALQEMMEVSDENL